MLPGHFCSIQFPLLVKLLQQIQSDKIFVLTLPAFGSSEIHLSQALPSYELATK